MATRFSISVLTTIFGLANHPALEKRQGAIDRYGWFRRVAANFGNDPAEELRADRS
jgi:hypothetical protein